jgi:hypothetical protein
VTLARRLARFAILGGLLGYALLAAPAGALADCAEPLPLEKAVIVNEFVFVGTVESADAQGRLATVKVEEVWRGDPATAVTVDGTLDPTTGIGEDDRVFRAGIRYLFLPSIVDGRFVDNLCTSTTEWQDGFEALRPPDVRPPSATSTAEGPLAFLGSLVLPAITVLIVGGGVLGVAFVVARRRDG